MITVEIDSTNIQTRSGTSKAGNPYTIRNQMAWLHNGKKYPSEFKIRLQDEQPPYQIGKYTVTPDSFYVDNYGQMTVNPQLEPIK